MLFHNAPDDPFVREILALRSRRSAITRPEFLTEITTPITIETREPDLQSYAKILEINLTTLSVQVDHPEMFQAGDRVMLLQRQSHEILVPHVTVLEVLGRWIYLDGVDPYRLSIVDLEDLLVREAEAPSIILSYGSRKIPQLTKSEIEQMREKLRDDPIEPPHPNLVRSPGQMPFGVMAQHFPLPDSPIPAGIVMLPIGAADGVSIKPHQHGWMLNRLVSEDMAFQRRWRHWADLQDSTELPRGRDIPFCRFDDPDENTLERILLCLSMIDPDWQRSPLKAIELFFDWLLWSLGHPSVPQFPPALHHAHNIMIQVFSPGRLILYPADYFGALLAIAKSPGLLSTKTATRLVKSIFPGRRNDYRDLLLLDPQCSSGALMLAASNYTYQYQAVTDNSLMAKATILNAYFYVPWAIFPFDWLPAPDATTTLTTALMVMRQQGIDPRYFDRVQLAPQSTSYLPVALVEPRPINAIAEWLSQQPDQFAAPQRYESLAEELPALELPPAPPLFNSPAFPTSDPNLLPPAPKPPQQP